MEARTLRPLIAAVFVFGLAGYFFATYTTTSYLQSTFNIPPGDYYYLSTTRNSGDSISGIFQVTSGNINFYIMSSAQYTFFQNNGSVGGVYSVGEATNGSISYIFTAQDTYYLVFRHGPSPPQGPLPPGFTQTVYFAWSYQTHDSSRLEFGILSLALGAVDLAFAFRSRKAKSLGTPPTVMPPFQPPSSSRDPTGIFC